MPKKASKVKDIGLDLAAPRTSCDDEHCPFHGRLSVRGQMLDGIVVSTKMRRTAVVKREYMRLIKKYERFQRRTRRIAAHNPPCLDLKVGDKVTIMECRPLSKTVSFVVVENRGH